MEVAACKIKGFILIFNLDFIGLLKLFLGFLTHLLLICGVLAAF